MSARYEVRWTPWPGATEKIVPFRWRRRARSWALHLYLRGAVASVRDTWTGESVPLF